MLTPPPGPQTLIDKLPRANYVTLRFFVRFLAHIVANEEVNKMSVKNMGIVVGPNLLRPAYVILSFSERVTSPFAPHHQ